MNLGEKKSNQKDHFQTCSILFMQLEQNLLTLDSQGAFDNEPIDVVLMSTREALEWYFKQLDHSVGLSFKVKKSLFRKTIHCGYLLTLKIYI
jgi:hypothetical protein